MIAAALERGIEVVGELELAWRAMPNRFLAVTGTNGKTTTVELLGHVYRTRRRAGRGRRQRRHAALRAGRRGRRRTRRSSARLELPARGHDRLRARVRGLPQPRARPPRPPRRPRGLPGGEAADLRQPGQRRRRRLQRRRPGAGRRRPRRLRAAGSPSATAPPPTARSPLAEGTIFYDGEPLLAVAELGLFGEHNVANAMAAAAAALAMGLDREAVREGLRSFAGVPHRLEQVAEIGGVRFVNDSKATNVASADGRAARLRGRRPRDPRRQREGRAVRAAARPGARALPSPAT